MQGEDKPAPALTVAVVNYNGERYLAETLRAVFAEQDALREVLLVDNASTDNGLRLVRERYPAVRVLRLRRNFGPARARSVAYRVASSDRILFVDNDAILAPDCARHLSRALDADPGAAVAVPWVLYNRDRGVVQYSGAAGHFTGLMTLLDADQPVDAASAASAQVRPIATLSSCCFMIDRQRWGAGGELFDVRLFSLLEDHDFGLRTSALGHRILSVRPARVFHGDGTEGLSIRRSGEYTGRRVYLLIRNRWQIILKIYQPRTVALLAPTLVLYELLQLAWAIKNGWLGEWLRALTWVARRLPETARRRRAIQRSRKARDGEILSAGPVPFTAYAARGRVEMQARRLLDRAAGANWRLVRRAL